MEGTDKLRMGTCKLDERHRITLPKPVLKYLKLSIGDFVSVESYNGNVCLFKAIIMVRRNNNYQPKEGK